MVILQQRLAQLVQALSKPVQPLLHAQQQIPAQHHRKPEIADSAAKFFGIHKLTPVRKQ